jgi:hypothetical protein
VLFPHTHLVLTSEIFLYQFSRLNILYSFLSLNTTKYPSCLRVLNLLTLIIKPDGEENLSRTSLVLNLPLLLHFLYPRSKYYLYKVVLYRPQPTVCKIVFCFQNVVILKTIAHCRQKHSNFFLNLSYNIRVIYHI